MHPALIEALSEARITDLHREAAHHRLARTAAAERPRTRTAVHRRLAAIRLAAIRLAAVRLAAVGRVDHIQPIEPPGPWCVVKHGVALEGDCRTVTATGR